MIKNFDKASSTVKEARRLEHNAETILAILEEVGRPMRCIEVAEYESEWWGDYIHKSNPHQISRIMHQLMSIGLVNRIEVEDEPIEVDKNVWISDKKDAKPIHIVVDGVTYQRTDHYQLRSGHWDTEKVTVTPHHAEFVLVK